MSTIDTSLPLSRRQRIMARIDVAPMLILGFSLLYFGQVLIRSSEKYFWYDEFFTIFMCRLPDLSSVWHALEKGADFNPPLFYIVTNLTKSVFGEGRLGMRLPGMVGFWIFCLSLFRFVRRRTSPGAAFAAMVLPTLTGAMYYAFEARPYGLVLGFCGLSLVCWQMAIERVRHGWWLVAFGLSLCGAFLMHCYALLLAFPFAAVEILRTFVFRRVDWGIWIAIILPAAISSAMYIPLTFAFKSLVKGTNFASLAPPDWMQLPGFYSFLLSPCVLVIVAMLLLFGCQWIAGTGRATNLPRTSIHETTLDMTLATAFLLIPAVAIILGKVVGGSFYPRYCLGAVAGLSLVVSLPTGVLGRANRLSAGLGILLGVAAVVQVSGVVLNRLDKRSEVLHEPSSGFSANISLMGPLDQYWLLVAKSGGSQPIGLLWPPDFLYLLNYAPNLAPRLYYIAGGPDDFFAPGLDNLRPWSPIHFNTSKTREEFLRLRSNSLIYGSVDQVFQMGLFTALGAHIDSFGASNEHFVAELKSTEVTH